MKKKWLFMSLLVVALATFTIGATTWDMTWSRFDKLWIGDSSDTPGQTLSDNSAYIAGDLEVTGTSYLTVGTIPTLTVATSITMPSKVHRIPIPLSSVFVDGTGPITSSSAPNLATTDNVGAITYDNSDETAEIQFPWYPDTSFTAMSVKMIITSSNADGTDNAVDWSIFVHGDGVDLPSATAQTGATLTSDTLDASEELVTLTLDATGIAAVTAGTSAVTVAVWNNSTDAYTLEIKKIWIEETRTK